MDQERAQEIYDRGPQRFDESDVHQLRENPVWRSIEWAVSVRIKEQLAVLCDQRASNREIRMAQARLAALNHFISGPNDALAYLSQDEKKDLDGGTKSPPDMP